MDLLTILTDSTCGEACWSAREEICRCSCGGKNHGCLRGEGGERPARMAKIAGVPYALTAIGTYRDLVGEARKINESVGFKEVHNSSFSVYHYRWNDSDAGAPARLKPASVDQCKRWPELAAYKDEAYRRPYLLWTRTTPAPVVQCSCAKCIGAVVQQGETGEQGIER